MIRFLSYPNMCHRFNLDIHKHSDKFGLPALFEEVSREMPAEKNELVLAWH